MTLYPLAHLGRARAAARLGHAEESREAFQTVLALWKDADPDLPVLVAGKRELQDGGAPSPARGDRSARLTPPEPR
jgi:hypothetical protein